MALTFLLLFLFGGVVGVMSGLLGIGGGIALVPGLMWLFGFSQQEAQGTSLAVLIPPIGIFAALVYYQHNWVRLPVVAWIAVGFMLGAYLGAHLVAHVPLDWLRLGFGALLVYTGFTFVMQPRVTHPAAALPAGVGTLAVTAFGLVRRRGMERKAEAAKPPDDDTYYHI
ncbi:MAG: sulfite exporter TauE/SafE family protein [Planctomycetia bacterium]|nr:sulfite exporter TauE/SafE family protein [Planctomycetia bacterium]